MTGANPGHALDLFASGPRFQGRGQDATAPFCRPRSRQREDRRRACLGGATGVAPHFRQGRGTGKTWTDTTTRNPLLLFLFLGLSLLRAAARRLFWLLLFQEPPRKHRPVGSG